MLLKSLPNDKETSIKPHLLKILQPSDRASLGGASPLMQRFRGHFREALPEQPSGTHKVFKLFKHQTL